jgi:hypothetical protein
MSRLNESGTIVDKYNLFVNESIIKVYKTQKKGVLIRLNKLNKTTFLEF